MRESSHLPGYGKLVAFRGTAMRTGVYVGFCLSLVFIAWLVAANRAPALEQFAWQRNVGAAAAICFFGLIPVLRFPRNPGRLWASGAVAWLLLSLTYRLACIFFPGLTERYSALQVFMVGAVVYTIVSTVCWIGTVVWRMRASHAHNAVPHAPASPSNHQMS